ncbi:MAG TPA: hypothetical protein PKL96_12495, partial [Bacteroidales bacterium]|nr:hypothetical protein [Bacteroidales bacterium]
EVFNVKDCPILGIYSHMIDNPLYLSNYPIGHLIQFQVEAYMKDKKFADEVIRMFSYGRTIPEVWMKYAVGEPISIQPMIKATRDALTQTGTP